MITEKQIEIAQALLVAGVNSVYHSCELIEDEKGEKYPAYKKGNEQYYVGPDDSKSMFAYIRNLGAVPVSRTTLEGSCSKLYQLEAPHRIVIFQDSVKDDFDSLINKFLSVAFIKDVSLVSFNHNAYILGKQESPIGKFAFDATTFYLAIDVLLSLYGVLGSEEGRGILACSKCFLVL